MWSIDELQKVWHLAAKLHDGQKYGGQNEGEKVEYLNHIGSVTFEILNAVNIEKDMNADLAIKCAILHDSIEDTKITDDLTYNFTPASLYCYTVGRNIIEYKRGD